MLAPRLDILPPPQRDLWPELAATPQGFILYGGTAIALRLGHRESVDFDFSAFAMSVSSSLLGEIPYLRAAEILQSAPGTITLRVDRGGSVKLSFFGPLRMGQVDAPEVALGNGIAVASLRDLAGVKVAVVTQRVEVKDYVDVHALLVAGVPLAEMLAAAAVIYGGEFNPLVALKALAYHEDLYGFSQGARGDLLRAIRGVDVRRLPVITPYRRRQAP